MYIAFFVLAGFAAFAFVLLAIVHPLVCVVQCLLAKGRPFTSKLVWTAVNLVTGIFGSLIYTFAASDSPKLKSVTATTVKGGLLCGVLAAGVFAISPDVRQQVSLSEQSVAAMEGEEVSFEGFDAALEELKTSLGELDEPSIDFAKLQEKATAFLKEEGMLEESNVEDVGLLTSTGSLDPQSFDAAALMESAETEVAIFEESNVEPKSNVEPSEVAPTLAETELSTEAFEDQDWNSLSEAIEDEGESTLAELEESEAAPAPEIATFEDKPSLLDTADIAADEPKGPAPTAQPFSQQSLSQQPLSSESAKTKQLPRLPSSDSARGKPTSAPTPVAQVNRYTGETVVFGRRMAAEATLPTRKPINRYMLEGNPALRSTGQNSGF
ncbi:MAG: hypothetical protein AB8B50_08810 [Pirellulaceae bacterium]